MPTTIIANYWFRFTTKCHRPRYSTCASSPMFQCLSVINQFFYDLQDYLSKLGGQTAEPQRIAATTTIQTPPPPSVEESAGSSANSTSTSVRKYLGSRSPSGQSPVTKSRKTPQYATISFGGSGNVGGSASGKESSDKEIGSPKSRTWKGLVARQFRKIQGQPSSPNSNYVQLPDGASIGVPLAQCPMVSASNRNSISAI